MAVYEDGIFDYEYAEYEYDFKYSHSTFYWEELLPTLLVYGVTLILGLIGNSLIVFTIYRYRRMQSATNMLLASLASADLLLIILCIPVKVGGIITKFLNYNKNV